MIIRNFYNAPLAQASYLVGCSATGSAIVIDPNRNVNPYIEMAQSLGLTIVAVTETHIHADYLSGTRELAAATNSRIYVSDEGGPDWQYEFADDPGVVRMKDGHRIEIGNLTLEAIHTPGHTPEHLSFLLVDHPMGETPHSLFSGDFIFAGDVGRPDLLERAANVQGTMETSARQLHQSIQKTASMPDSLLIWPGHGAGSACGKSLGGSPVTSLGYERRTNWAFQIHDVHKFVDEVLSGQPEPPRYFKEMKRLNKAGPYVLGGLPSPPRSTRSKGRVVDFRKLEAIHSDFLPGIVAIPNNNSLTTWAGWLLTYSEPVTLLVENQDMADHVARSLSLIGLDVVTGWVERSDFAEIPPSAISRVGVRDITEDDFVLDVRGLNEWTAMRMQGAFHIPLGDLQTRIGELPTDRRIVVHCSSGGRSPIAYSILRANGFESVVELSGGIEEICQLTPERLAVLAS